MWVSLMRTHTEMLTHTLAQRKGGLQKQLGLKLMQPCCMSLAGLLTGEIPLTPGQNAAAGRGSEGLRWQRHNSGMLLYPVGN